MAVNIPALREWADGILAVMPPEHEAYDRAQTAAFLIVWGADAYELLRLRPDDDAQDLARRWRQAVQ
jgi:hypothetical protein